MGSVLGWRTKIPHSEQGGKKKSVPRHPAISSVSQFSCSVMSNSLWPHRLQHARPPCPSPTPGAYSNSRPSSWWCHLTISSSVVPFSSCLQYFPASGSFHLILAKRPRSDQGLFKWVSSLLRRPKYWSISFSISPSNEYSGLMFFAINWFDLLAVQRTLESLLQHHSSKASVLPHSVFFMVQLPHPYLTTGKTVALYRWTFVVGSNVSAF